MATQAYPGTEEKLAELERRYAAGEPFWQPGDRTNEGRVDSEMKVAAVDDAHRNVLYAPKRAEKSRRFRARRKQERQAGK